MSSNGLLYHMLLLPIIIGRIFYMYISCSNIYLDKLIFYFFLNSTSEDSVIISCNFYISQKYFQITHNIKQVCMSFSERKSISFKESSTDVTSSISTFVIKIYNLLNDPQNAQAICWHSDGASFLIKDTALLTSRVLPFYFRHNNYQSFIRQLNMYSFVKLKDHAVHRFKNSCFLREKEELLKFIKRKPQKKKRRQSDEWIESQKENEVKGTGDSSYHIQIEPQVAKCPFPRPQTPKVQDIEHAPAFKRVRFDETAKGGNSDENISTIIEATSKWINNKEENYWSNIKSLKSIELSMKLIDNQEEEERDKLNVKAQERRNTLDHPIILLFNPNISEKTIKSIGIIANEEN